MTCKDCRYFKRRDEGRGFDISHCYVEPVPIERKGDAPTCRHFKCDHQWVSAHPIAGGVGLHCTRCRCDA